MSIHRMQNTTSKGLRLARRGFTLIELLVVIAIIALLSSLTIGAFSYATKAAARNRTEATFAAIKLGLTSYFSEYKEYPEPAQPDQTISIGSKRYTSGGAAMLYQAMSGDGNNAILIGAGESGESSNGQFTKEEAARTMMRDMPPTTWKKIENTYVMVDGFNHPFQYTHGGNGTNDDAVNPSSYDLWSYGEDEQNINQSSHAAKIDPKTSAKWIKNW
ncbi:MAG: type II secretion system protein [Verrucomicrobiaceae bacterium]|nr:type II secretion system protein [Verrucomicrobiaceae bacterium]